MAALKEMAATAKMLRGIISVCLLVLPHWGWAVETGPNLISNPGFDEIETRTGLPRGWQSPGLQESGIPASRVFLCRVSAHPGKLLALVGGTERRGRVWFEIKGIRPHTDYLLEFLAYRPRFTNGVYLEVKLFGRCHLINQHFTYGRVQPILLRINSGTVKGMARLVLENPHQEVLAFGSPSLRTATPAEKEERKVAPVPLPVFFPVGIFAASPADLPAIRDAGFNAVQSYDPHPDTIRRMAAGCSRLGLKYLPNFRRYQADISRELGGRPELLGFYIEDEPEGRSVPPEKLKALKESLRRDHPQVLTVVAMLRPQMVAYYHQAADVFLLDPYPIPHMPLTWLADTLAEAAQYVSQERLWAVIQTFGGEKYAKDGWPRRPTYLEMRCLTYLALVHGAHGLFYFSYPEAQGDPISWEGLQWIVGQLRHLHTWLVVPQAPVTLKLEMTSPFRADAAGRPAVHFCQKQLGPEHLLILVNVIDRPVSFYLYGFPPQVKWLTEVFQQDKSVVLDGNIREKLGPYEVRVYRY